MGRRRRVLFKDKLYEIVPRAREGLPFPCTQTTNILLQGILARIQRDDKVILTNFVNMNNHDHIHAIPKEPRMFTRFYCEYQKKRTDTLRKLLGRKSLKLWEERATVMHMQNLEDAVERLIYLLCNPAKAHRSDSIETYKGLSFLLG